MAIVELVMPRMGESIIEATIIEWTKKEGEFVEIDETVLEVATDKIDSEVPSPVSGKIKKILFQKDDVVAVDKVIALIETDSEDPQPESPIIKEEESKPAQQDVIEQPSRAIMDTKPDPTPAQAKFSKTIGIQKIPSTIGDKFYSPLVRNIARAEGLSLEELQNVEGTGAEGRVTKFDLLNYLEQRKFRSVRPAVAQPDRERTSVSMPSEKEFESHSARHVPNEINTIVEKPGFSSVGDEIIELSRMRQIIAQHMTQSLATSAHVTSFVEADATRLVNWRNRMKESFQRKYGEKLTFSPLFVEAVLQALRDYPRLNASIVDNHLVIKKDLNIGVATAMDNGNLIVPVIKDAGQMNLLGLTKHFNDITTRARKNQLRPEEISGGTFTISNIGTFGNIMGTPIINQPELAVLALGAIKKKPIIQETSEGDIIAIRHMMFLSLSFDHRVIDGYKGGTFLNRIAYYIENFDSNRPI